MKTIVIDKTVHGDFLPTTFSCQSKEQPGRWAIWAMLQSMSRATYDHLDIYAGYFSPRLHQLMLFPLTVIFAKFQTIKKSTSTKMASHP